MATDIDLHLGRRLRRRRRLLGLTQQQMAELIGVTYQQAHKYESGTNRIAAGRLFGHALEDGHWYTVGTPDGLTEVEAHLAAGRV